jgi:LCP family protein required for cell wall assembly
MPLTESPDEFESPRGGGASIRSNPSGIRSNGLAVGPEAAAPASVTTEPAVAPTPRRRATPALAAVASLLFPGAGQLFAGAIRRGLLLALPTVALIVVVAAALGDGIKPLLAQLVQPGVLLGIVAVNAVYAIYHLFAIADAWWVARRRRPAKAGPRSVAALVVALILAVGLHGLVGGLGVQAAQTVSAVLPPAGSGISIPAASTNPTGILEPGASSAPTPTPGPAYAADGRLNLLLIGGDAGPGRTLLRTDTMILLSVDIATGRAALFGIPRNLLNVPVAAEDAKFFRTNDRTTNGRFPGLLNALWVYAYQRHDFPAGGCTPVDSDKCGIARGFRAITGAVQALVGVPLDGAVVVNLNGFVDLVDAVAPQGIWLRTEAVYDTRYPLEDGTGYITVNITAGCHRLDGHTLLEYARSRHQDSDYGRMARQQQVLVALLHQIDPIALIPQISNLLDIAKTNVILAIPSADLGSLASLASSVDPATVQKIGFDPQTGYFEYVTSKEITRIQQATADVFATPAANPSASPTASAAPSPTARPCPGPNVSPSATASP